MSFRESVRSIRFRAILLLVLTFAAGLATGIAGDRLVLLRQRRILPSTGLQMVSERVIRQMDRRLDLSGEQESEIRGILEQRRRRIDSIWAEVQPRVQEQIARSHNEIRKTLTAEQQAEFDRMVVQWKRRARAVLGEEPGR